MPYVAGPFDDQHIYLQWGGKLPGGEEWSCGLRLADTVESNVMVSPAMLAAYTAAVSAYHANASAGLSPRAKLSFVKANNISLDGTYTLDTTNETVVADVAGGGTEANTPANQIALCVSLTTGFSRGPAHRGRFYLPLPTFSLSDQGVFNPANAVTVSTATDSFVAALNAAHASYKVAVFSRKSGAAAHRVVTGNLVGTVYDTQRRRRRSLVENYQ